MLARHLETIEADMLEREAAFAQLQRDRDTIEKVRLAINHQNSMTEVYPMTEGPLHRTPVFVFASATKWVLLCYDKHSNRRRKCTV